MQLRCLIARFSVAIPKYRPKIEPITKDIPMPKRPKLDPNDPYERYELVKPRQYEFRQALDEFHDHQVYPGSNYVAVHRNGITYHLFDASRYPYGKMCNRISYLLSGKHKPTYRRNEAGQVTDKFVIVNGCNMYLTGRKIDYKVLTYHTGYVGHLRQLKFKDLILQKPEQLVAWTVSKMLPKTKFRMEKLDHIHVFRGRFHNYNMLPQFLPHRTDFEYRGGILADIKEGDDRTIIRTGKPMTEAEIKQQFGDIKQEIIDPADLDQEEIFTPFMERHQKIHLTMSKNQFDKLLRRRKHLMKRYIKRMVKPYGKPQEKADFTRSYLVTSEKQLNRLGLQNIKPLDDDPELDDETVKF